MKILWVMIAASLNTPSDKIEPPFIEDVLYLPFAQAGVFEEQAACEAELKRSVPPETDWPKNVTFHVWRGGQRGQLYVQVDGAGSDLVSTCTAVPIPD